MKILFYLNRVYQYRADRSVFIYIEVVQRIVVSKGKLKSLL